MFLQISAKGKGTKGPVFLEKKLKNAEFDTGIVLSFPGNYKKISIAEIVAMHQTGTNRMPARPFLILLGTKFEKNLKLEIFNDNNPEEIGRKIVNLTKSIILSMNKPALALRTVKKKKFSKLLIHTRRMINSTTFEIIKGKRNPSTVEMRKLINQVKKQSILNFVSGGKLTPMISGEKVPNSPFRVSSGLRIIK